MVYLLYRIVFSYEKEVLLIYVIIVLISKEFYGEEGWVFYMVNFYNSG